MVKTLLNLYVDSGNKELAKSKGINLSRLFDSMIEIELGFKAQKSEKTKEENIQDLKVQNAHLISELKLCNEDKQKFYHEVENMKNRLPARRVIKPAIF